MDSTLLEVVNVLVAGAVAWVFGAVWYMAISSGWMSAAGLSDEQVRSGGWMPHAASLVGAIVVAGMLRHILASSGIETVFGALVTGLGLGLFVVSPWIVNTVMYGQRDRRLIWMDCGYPVVGMALMGAVLALF